MQRISLRISLASGLLSILTMYLLAAQPTLRLWGAVIGFGFAQVLTLALNLLALVRTAPGALSGSTSAPEPPCACE